MPFDSCAPQDTTGATSESRNSESSSLTKVGKNHIAKYAELSEGKIVFHKVGGAPKLRATGRNGTTEATGNNLSHHDVEVPGL